MGAIVLAFLIVAVAALGALALWRDRGALVLDLVKVLAGALGGGGFGYAVGRGRSDRAEGTQVGSDS